MGLLSKKEKNIDKPAKEWGSGIPNYSQDDLMTEYDKLNFAMNIVKQCELDANGYDIVAATDQVGQIPNFVCEKDGKRFFIVVKCDIAPEMPIPAYNNLKPFHTKGSKWVGYIVKMDGVTYYIAGDTDANEDVKKVKCDIALIPIGGHYTMDKKQAADLICCMKPKAAIPTHYGEVVGSPTDGGDFKDYIDIVDKEIQVELKL